VPDDGYALASPPFCLSNSAKPAPARCDDECATRRRPNNQQIFEALGERRQFQALAGAANPGFGDALALTALRISLQRCRDWHSEVEADDAETSRLGQRNVRLPLLDRRIGVVDDEALLRLDTGAPAEASRDGASSACPD